MLPTLTVGKGVESWARLCRRISVPAGLMVFSVPEVVMMVEEEVVDEEPLPCIHGWLKMSSKDGLSEGLSARHHLINCWHSGERRREGGEEREERREKKKRVRQRRQ